MPDATRWAAMVGSRVVVRRRLPDGRLGDVLGELEEARGGVLRVRTSRGAVEVQLTDVITGKVVPPRAQRAAPPHRALSVLALERVMADHWRALESERLGDWLLRASRGFTGRGNSVLAVGDPGRPLSGPLGAVEAVAEWYAGRGLPPMASVPGLSGGDDDPASAATPVAGPEEAASLAAIRDAFAGAGWRVREGAGALVLTAPTAELRAAGPRVLPDGLEVVLLDEPDEAWLACYRYRGQPVPPEGVALLRSAPEQVFVAVRAGPRTVGVSRGSLARAWAGLTAVDVDPAFRRRGLAGAMLAAAAGWAWRRGAASTFLQVADGNSEALALYRGAGFIVHHRYDYLVAPG